MTATGATVAKGQQTGRRLRPGVRVAIYVSLIVTSIVMIGPFYWTFATSFKPAGDVFASPPKLIPNPWTMQNYRDVFTLLPFQRYFINSVIVTTAIVGLNVVFDTAAAYAFAKLRFPGRNVLVLPAAIDADGPVPGEPDPALPDHGAAPPGEPGARRGHVLGHRAPGDDPGLRHLLDAAVPRLDPRRGPRVGSGRRRVGVPDPALGDLPDRRSPGWRRWRSSRSSGHGTTSCGRTS